MEEIKTTFKTNAICRKCGQPLYTSDVETYSFVCYKCDENYFGIETRGIKGNFLEITVPFKENHQIINQIEEWANDVNYVGDIKFVIVGKDKDRNIIHKQIRLRKPTTFSWWEEQPTSYP